MCVPTFPGQVEAELRLAVHRAEQARALDRYAPAQPLRVIYDRTTDAHWVSRPAGLTEEKLYGPFTEQEARMSLYLHQRTAPCHTPDTAPDP